MNLANESYFMIENEIKRINLVLEKLKFEKNSLETNCFSFNNYLIHTHYDEIFNLENHVNSKRRAKGKKLLNDTELLLDVKNLKKKRREELKGNNKRGKTLGIKRKENIEKYTINQNDKIVLDNKNNNPLIKEYCKKSCLPDINNEGWEDVTYQELDGKIGQIEPIYCFCNYISYGNMIKCDNPNCEREWFHFHCVGLKNQPKGKWFCSERCAKEFQKKYFSQKKTKPKKKSKKKK